MVDVWWADLSGFDAAACWDALDGAERARADRFRVADAKRRFAVSHAMARSVLGFDGAFVIGEHGKPSLPGGPRFSLSHSGERAVVAVCADRDVGVDVEALRPVGPGVAERVLSDEELAGWRGAVDRDRFLLEVWTRKEAVVKATGEGITRSLRTLSYDGFEVVPLDVGEGYLAALAVAGPGPVEVTVRRWAG